MPVADRLKQLHQSMDTVRLFRPITKFSAEIDSPDSVSEVSQTPSVLPSRDDRGPRSSALPKIS